MKTILAILATALLLAACEPPPGKHCATHYEFGLLTHWDCD